jgi:hypothetical protein
MWQRRHAIQLAAQLPEDQADALLILEFAREIVIQFMGERPVLRDDEGSVVHFPGKRRDD